MAITKQGHCNGQTSFNLQSSLMLSELHHLNPSSKRNIPSWSSRFSPLFLFFMHSFILYKSIYINYHQVRPTCHSLLSSLLILFSPSRRSLHPTGSAHSSLPCSGPPAVAPPLLEPVGRLPPPSTLLEATGSAPACPSWRRIHMPPPPSSPSPAQAMARGRWGRACGPPRGHHRLELRGCGTAGS